MVEDLADQIRHDGAVVAGELGDRGGRLVLVGEHQRCEPQARSPSLGALDQQPDLVAGERQAVALEQLRGLGRREREVACADLGQLVSEPQPLQRQPGVNPRADHDPKRGWVRDQRMEDRGQLGAVGLVEVVEHERHRSARGAQRGEDAVSDVVGCPGWRTGRRRLAQRRRERVPEPVRARLRGGEREPGHAPGGAMLARPVSHQHRLSCAHRPRDQGEGPLDRGLEGGGQSPALDGLLGDERQAVRGVPRPRACRTHGAA